MGLNTNPAPMLVAVRVTSHWFLDQPQSRTEIERVTIWQKQEQRGVFGAGAV
jgi:hypothetical protein